MAKRALTVVCLWSLIFLTGLSPGAAQAQAAPKGTYLVLNFGYGRFWPDADGFKSTAMWHVRGGIGRSLSEKIALGLDGYLAADGFWDANRSLANVSLSATYYPRDRFFFKGGVAYGIIVDTYTQVPSNYGLGDDHPGLGITLGIGAFISLGRGFGLLPELTWLHQRANTSYREYRTANEMVLRPTTNFLAATIGILISI